MSPKKSKELSSAQIASPFREKVFSESDALAELQREFGASGTYLSMGYLAVDYNNTLIGSAATAIYEKMRKSDATVHATLLAMELPIRATEWVVESQIDDETGEVPEEASAIAEFVEDALFEKMEITWDDLLRQVLTMLVFGYSIFEKVYAYPDEEGKIYLRKLAMRQASSLLRWQQQDGTAGITQALPTMKVDNTGDKTQDNLSMNLISIPKDKLVIFSFRREGDNYEGVSTLRSAYRSYVVKDRLMQFEAIKHERQAIGIPIIYVPNIKDNVVEATKIVRNIRATEETGVVIPMEWKFEYADIKANATSNVKETIQFHNREITKNILAQFLELGGGDTGSFALSEDQSSLFLLSLSAVAKQVRDTFNREIIPQLVAFNFPNSKYIPKLAFRKLGEVDYAKMATAVSGLITASAITPDKDLEASLRKMMDLPPKLAEEPADGQTPPDQGQVPPDGQTSQGEAQNTAGQPSEADLNALANDPEMAKLEKEVATLCENVEIILQLGEIPLDDREAYEDMVNGLEFGTMTDSHRSAISAALKKYWANHGVQQPKTEKTAGAQDISNTTTATKNEFATVKDNFKRQVSEARMQLKQQVAKIVKGKAGKAARDKLKIMWTAKIEQIKGFRDDSIAKYRTAIQGLTGDLIAKRNTDRAMLAAAKKTAKTNSKTMKEHECDENCHHDFGKTDHSYLAFSDLVDNAYIRELQAQVESPSDLSELKKKGLVINESEGRFFRPLTLAERKVNLGSIERSMDTLSSQVDEAVKGIVGQQRDYIVGQIKMAVEAGDYKKLGAITISAKLKMDLSSALTDTQKQAFEIGKKTAATEMKVLAPPTAQEIKGVMRVQNDAVAERVAQQITEAATSAVSQAAAAYGGSVDRLPTAAAIKAVSMALDRITNRISNNLTTLSVVGAINTGRATIYERYPERIYAFQWSAILDNRTCDYCMSLDGRVVAAGSGDFYDYQPPVHARCRCLWVEILNEEVYKPDITDIPNSIPSSATIEDFQQISAPKLLKGAAAISIVKEKIAVDETKLRDLEAKGGNLKRKAALIDRITKNKNAIKNAGEAEPVLTRDELKAKLQGEGVRFK